MSSGVVRRVGAATVAVLAAGVLAGCGSDETEPVAGGTGAATTSATPTQSPASGTSPSATTSTPTGSPAGSASPGAVMDVSPEEQQRILEQYRAYFPAADHASSLPEPQRRNYLDDYAVNPSLDRNLSGMIALDAMGVRIEGRSTLAPTLVSVDKNVAVVHDCQDNSQVGQVEIATGKRRTKGAANTAVESKLRRGSDGLWRVSEVKYQERDC